MLPIPLSDFFVAVAVSLWFGLTVLNQLAWPGGLVERVRILDAAATIPIWTFFAPRPGITDYLIVYRNRTVDDTDTNWKPLQLTRPSLWRFIWNPDKRLDKLVTDCASTLLAGYNLSERDYLISIPYLVLLRMVENAQHDFRAEAAQFGIVAVQGFHRHANYRLAFLSGRVRLVLVK